MDTQEEVYAAENICCVLTGPCVCKKCIIKCINDGIAPIKLFDKFCGGDHSCYCDKCAPARKIINKARPKIKQKKEPEKFKIEAEKRYNRGIKRLEKSEQDLLSNDVPKEFICYLSCNDEVDDDISFNDRRGGLFWDRDDIIKQIECGKNALVILLDVTEMVNIAIDGRNISLIQAYIGCDWGKEDTKWQLMELQKRGGKGF